MAEPAAVACHSPNPSSPNSGDANPLRLRTTAESCLPETLIKWFAVLLAAAVFALAG